MSRHLRVPARRTALDSLQSRGQLVALLCALAAGAVAAGGQSSGVDDLLGSAPVRVFSQNGVTDPAMPSAPILFGAALSLDGDLLAVGAPNEWASSGAAGTSQTGAVYLFERDGETWSETQKLRAPSETSFERFGAAVGIVRGEDLDGPLDILVVGGPGFNAGQGRAHVFHHRPGDPWQFITTLTAAAPDAADGFGTGVAIDWFVPPNTLNGDPLFFIAVGAPMDKNPDDTGNTQHGSVSVFQRGGGPLTWGDAQPFYGLDPNDHIGSAVAMAGPDVVAAGDGIDVPGGADDGGALAVQQQNSGGTGFLYAPSWELQPSAPLFPTGIGASAALHWTSTDAGTAALGAPLDDTGAQVNRGKVYIYDLVPGGAGTTRFEVASVLGSATGQGLGEAVALSGSLLLATSAGSDAFGAVEVWQRGATKADWTHAGAFDTPNGPSAFSPCTVRSSVAIDDGTVAIGCTGDSLENEGVYLYFPRRLFEDGFENGDTTNWSSSAP